MFVFDALFERRIGRIYYTDSPENTLPWWYPYLLQPLLHLVISDTTFYLWVMPVMAVGPLGHRSLRLTPIRDVAGVLLTPPPPLPPPLPPFLTPDSTHRFWHTSWMYKNSHYQHHSCRPTTSFAGNAADPWEVALTGYVTALMPAFIVPCEASMFMMLTLFGHMWSIYLHNYECHVMPGWVYDSYDHNVHHHYGEENYNFSLYFEFWDRVFATYVWPRRTADTSETSSPSLKRVTT